MLFSIGQLFSRGAARFSGGKINLDPKASRRLPPEGASSDIRLWRDQLAPAARLMEELKAMLPSDKELSAKGAMGSGNAGGVRWHPRGQLKPQSDLGKEAGAALPAQWLDARTMVMETPGNAASAAWAATCLRHNVRTVIDLSSPSGPQRASHCMKSNAPWVGREARAEFRCPIGGPKGLPIEGVLRDCDAPTTLRKVGVSLSVKGEPLVAARPEAVPSSWNNGTHQASLELSWIRMPLEPGRAVSPRVLLQTCRLLDRLHPGTDDAIAFQSADGGHRAALLAAARDVYRSLSSSGRRSPDQLRDAVLEAAVRARANLSPDVLQQPEEFASLLSMAELMARER